MARSAVERRTLFCLLILLFLAGCSPKVHHVGLRTEPARLLILPQTKTDADLTCYRIDGASYYPLEGVEEHVQVGEISWYGPKFHGNPTSSGERFDMYRKSAAHKTLPLGTFVEVENLANHRRTVVRINDRGPFVKDRILDLSYAAAREIDMVRAGVTRARLVVLGKEVDEVETPLGIKPVVHVKDLKSGGFSVQVGAFKDHDRALRLGDRLEVIFNHVEISLFNDRAHGDLYRVRVSKSETLSEAGEIERRLKRLGFEEAFIVRL